MKEVQQLPVNSDSDVKFWQREAASLRRQLHDLQKSQQQLIGEALSDLTVNDLQHLESQLEMSLRTIRKSKDQILIDEIQELNRKENLIHQENLELYKKVLATSSTNGVVSAGSSIQYSTVMEEGGAEPILLELSQPQQQTERAYAKAPELGLYLH